MIEQQMIPRIGLYWLLVAMVASILPHLPHLPIWVVLVSMICMGWRIGIFQGRGSYPSTAFKGLLVITAFLGVYFAYGSLLGLEPTVSLLVLAFVFKLLELSRKRDTYIVIFLAYFLVITEFVFDQSIPITILMMGIVIIITAALVGLENQSDSRRIKRTFNTALVMVGKSIPIMIVLFLLFPRLPPLWSMPLPGDQAITGISDRMRPGDIVELGQSDQLAFRATFDGPIPEPSQLYWRGLVLTQFDGQEWSYQSFPWSRLTRRNNKTVTESVADVQWQGMRYNYTVILEPTYQRWLFGLDTPMIQKSDAISSNDLVVLAQKPITQSTSYRVSSYLNAVKEPELLNVRRASFLQLPEKGNEQSFRLAQQWYQEVGADPLQYIDRLKKYYNLRFTYTLKPPPLGANSIDDFLLGSQRGFCAHFAGSFAFMLRAVGIPARVIIGYQGGEINPVSGHVSVHQFDAHAWTEAWFEGEGWKRLDPTAWVSPMRIELGLEAALREENSFLADDFFSAMRYRDLPLINLLRIHLDSMDYWWNVWVLGYNPQTQLSTLTKWFGSVSLKQLAFIMGAVIVAIWIIFFVSGWWLSYRYRSPKVVRYYDYFCRSMATLDLPRAKGEAPQLYVCRIKTIYPSLTKPAHDITQLFVELAYSIDANNRSLSQTPTYQEKVRKLQRLVWQFRWLQIKHNAVRMKQRILNRLNLKQMLDDKH